MNNEIKEIIDIERYRNKDDYIENINLLPSEIHKLLNYITNLQEENKIKDTNWESLKYYLEKLYYKDYIEEAISDDIDKKIKELESKVEIKGYQKDIKALQEENEKLNKGLEYAKRIEKDYKTKFDKVIKLIDENYFEVTYQHIKNEGLKCVILDQIKDILQGSDK